MPLSFYHDFDTAESFSINHKTKQVQNLLKYIAIKENEMPSDAHSTYNITLKLETKLVRSSSTTDMLMKYGDGPNAVEINLKDEDFKQRFPYEYKTLTDKLKNRYVNFKCNAEYHQVRKRLEKKAKYCRERQLDPGNPNSLTKKFYSSEIIKKFDEHYERNRRNGG